MPLLKRELDLFPTSLFEQSPEQSPWWVAHVRSRQEKSLARYLRPIGVPFYLPQREHRSRQGSRTRVSYLPLFPGYLFFRGTAVERLAALRSNLLVRVLEVSDQTLLTRELEQLHSIQRSGATLIPLDRLVPGDPVRIVDGPFKGYVGIVARGGERPRLVVSISVLRKAVAVELDRSAVALLPAPRESEKDARSAVA